MSIWLLSLLASFVLIPPWAPSSGGANTSLPRSGKIKRCVPVAAPAPARITSIKSASRRPKSNLTAAAIAAEIRSAK